MHMLYDSDAFAVVHIQANAPAEGWLTGAEYSIGDIAVASTLKTLGYVDFAPDAARHPATAAWYDRVTSRPAWQDVLAREDKILSTRLAAA